MTLAERIAARKALGLSAEEFNALEKQQATEKCDKQQRAIAACIKAGLTGNDRVIDAAIASYMATN